MLDKALKVIPKDKQRMTRIVLKATAGLRMISETASDKILDNVTILLVKLLEYLIFNFKNCCIFIIFRLRSCLKIILLYQIIMMWAYWTENTREFIHG